MCSVFSELDQGHAFTEWRASAVVRECGSAGEFSCPTSRTHNATQMTLLCSTGLKRKQLQNKTFIPLFNDETAHKARLTPARLE